MPIIAADRIQYLKGRIVTTDDPQAYKELFTGLYSYLYRFAIGFVKTRQPAEEIVSDVFIKLWEKRKDMGAITNLKVYLYIAIRNTAFNYLEKQKNFIAHSIDDHADMRSVYFDPEQLLITAEMLNRIYKAIESLPPKCRMIFRLVKEDGLRYKEVADILHISVKTVENQLAIAVRKIGKAVSFDISRSISSSLGQNG